MSALVATLTLLWALQEPTPAAASRSPCERTDNACKARMFVKKAATAEPDRRALYLFTASRSYLALFAQTGDVQHLCAARTNFEASLAVPEQTASQRASFEESRTELEALEKQHSARCRPTNRRKKADSIAVARTTPAATPKVEAPASVQTTPVTTPSSAAMPIELLVASAATSEHVAPDDGLLAVPVAKSWRPAAHAAPAPVPEAPRRARAPGRPLVISGGVTLGVGVVLAGIAGYSSAQVAAASRASYDLYEQTQGQGGVDVIAAEADIHRNFNRWLPPMIGTAIAGTTAVIAGAVMLRVGIRRMRQGPPRAALVPVPGGLAIHGRF